VSERGRRRISLALPAAAFLVALAAFHFVRRYPWPLAGVVALAIAVLTFTALRASAEIRDAWLARWRRQDREP
jgi:hypothetical protein